MNIEKTLEQLYTLLVGYTPKIAGAILAWIVGSWLVSRISIISRKALLIRNFDPSISKFLISLISIGLKVLLLFSIAGILGIETTSFVAVLGAASLAVGLALQGSLSNFAGSVLILFFKPYKVGDMITFQVFTGVVREIQTFSTVLETTEGQIIILPNGIVANGAIINQTGGQQRRVEYKFKVSNVHDSEMVKGILLNIAKTESMFSQEPAPNVVITMLEDNAYFASLVCWLAPEDYVSSASRIAANIHEKVQSTFTKQGIVNPPA